MSSSTVVLLVDCDQRLAAIIKKRIEAIKCCQAEEFQGIQATLERARHGGVGLLLWHVPAGSDVQQALRQLAAVGQRQIPLVTIIDADDRDLRLQLLANGAVDCLAQPVDQARLEFLIDILTVKGRCSRCKTECEHHVVADSLALQVSDYVSDTPHMRHIMHMVSRVAPLDTTVLLNGETGTGKTYTARLIHELSPRRQRPFVVVHCGSLPPTLLESELFGHRRGAFTGADRDYIGKLAAAEDGTVLLDEIDAVPVEAQVKLLQVVEERVFEPLGSTQTIPFRARLIAATNRPLEAETAAGRFRADLYYRLNVVALCLPPLRERPDAVWPLAQGFLESLSRHAGREVIGFSDAARWALESYAWPGNIRELRNVIEHTVVLTPHPVVELADLPESLQHAYGNSPFRFDRPAPAAANELAAARKGGELERLREALQRNNSSRTGAAAELGISRVTLYKKLHQHRLI